MALRSLHLGQPPRTLLLPPHRASQPACFPRRVGQGGRSCEVCQASRSPPSRPAAVCLPLPPTPQPTNQPPTTHQSIQARPHLSAGGGWCWAAQHSFQCEERVGGGGGGGGDDDEEEEEEEDDDDDCNEDTKDHTLRPESTPTPPGSANSLLALLMYHHDGIMMGGARAAEARDLRLRFHEWKARSKREDQEIEWDLSLVDVLTFDNRHELHLLLTERITSVDDHLAELLPSAPSSNKPKDKKALSLLNLVNGGGGGSKTKQECGDEEEDRFGDDPVSSPSPRPVEKRKPSVLGSFLGRGGHSGNSKSRSVMERPINLVLQLPLPGNMDSVYFLERTKADHSTYIAPL